MREIRTSGSEGGGIETNRFSLPLSVRKALISRRSGLLDARFARA
jgi:hypothetical protein